MSTMQAFYYAPGLSPVERDEREYDRSTFCSVNDEARIEEIQAQLKAEYLGEGEFSYRANGEVYEREFFHDSLLDDEGLQERLMKAKPVDPYVDALLDAWLEPLARSQAFSKEES